MNFPTLYKLTSTGKLQEWTISVEETSIGTPRGASWGVILTRYGLTGGKIQEAREDIRVGKNVGKANATTPIEQAWAEAQAQWEKKKKNKGYVESIEAAKAGERDALVAGGIDPMLAHKYSDHAAKISWPAYVQPKLDGHRCIAVIQDGVCTLWSRTRKPILSMPHIVAELERMFPNGDAVLDGELYNHDYREKFEELTSKIRQSKPVAGHEVVEYWVYDCVVDFSFDARLSLIETNVTNGLGPSKVRTLQTFEAESETDMIDLFGTFLAHGFEGAMVRNKNSQYKNGRSYDLQKVKMFQDAEFEIVDVVPGKGHMVDKGVFVCKTEEGKEFKAKMVGNLDELRKYLDNKEAYIGKMLTVKFQKFSAEGIPVFGVAMRIREDV